MIPANRIPAQPVRWQQLWREAVTDPHELLRLLDLSAYAATLLPERDTEFALRVPRGFVARMRRGDPADPLLRQVLPRTSELEDVTGYSLDAVGDIAARAASGVLHKYQGRALLIATGSCAVNCRYCFRRHFPYAEQTAAANRWSEAIAHVRSDPSIGEVILSGGDPLSLSTPKLAELTRALATVPHVRRIRIHTRLPVVLSERIDPEFLDWFAGLPFQRVVVLHANHPNEIDSSVVAAAHALRDAGATVLNQAVLLKGVNDDADTLASLSERLFDAGVLPYYLHQLDRVAGAAHFEVDDAVALALLDALRVRLPGYLVPRLVREVTGAPFKRPLQPESK
jgi:EF-P beta-lysylation protein EpmB